MCQQMPPENLYGGCAKEPCKQPKVEYLKEYEIRIRFLSRGCVITVGCREVPFTSIEEAMLALNAYVTNPRDEIGKWNDLFNKNE